MSAKTVKVDLPADIFDAPVNIPLMHQVVVAQQAALGVDGVHRQVLGGLALGAHPTGHPDALEDATGGRAGADGTG